MPSFSVPHSSHASEDIDTYLERRANGTVRSKAVLDLGLANYSYQTWKRLDQRCKERSLQMQTLGGGFRSPFYPGYRDLQERAGGVLAVEELNRTYMESYGRSWFFGNLRWLAVHFTAGAYLSHKVITPQAPGRGIDSS